MRILWTVALLIASLAIQAQTLEDVIYKKDGSVLRGTLVEQDFANGRYKIQLQGGSLFSVNKDDIEKITKEAPTSSISNANGININIDNNPVINQNPSVTQSPSINTSSQALTSLTNHKHTFYIARMAKKIDDDDENGFIYRGVSYAYQYTINEHYAIYADHNRATLTGALVDGKIYRIPFVNEDDFAYQGTQVLAMLSSNNHQGWQFYTGLGVFSENTELSGTELSASGVSFALGMGYSWERLQLHMRIIGQSSDDYEEIGEDYSGSITNIQLGFNF